MPFGRDAKQRTAWTHPKIELIDWSTHKNTEIARWESKVFQSVSINIKMRIMELDINMDNCSGILNSSVRPFSWSGLFGVVQSELGAGELLRLNVDLDPSDPRFLPHCFCLLEFSDVLVNLFNDFLMTLFCSHSFLMHFVCVFLVFACCILSLYLCTTRYASPGSHLMMFRSQINHVSRFSKLWNQQGIWNEYKPESKDPWHPANYNLRT